MVWYLQHRNSCLEKENIVNKDRRRRRRTAETDSALEKKLELKMLNVGRFCMASNVLFYGLGSCVGARLVAVVSEADVRARPHCY